MGNFNDNGYGRLALEVDVYKQHTNGESDKHKAKDIILSPEIGGYSNVHDAIYQLYQIITPLSLSDATTSSKGIIQLAGDIAGSATNISVVALRGRSISNTVPTDGHVLTWDELSTSWKPKSAPNGFSAAGDLTGNSVLQNVVALTGSSGVVSIPANTLRFSNGISPTISQSNNASGNGSNLTIKAQTSTQTSGNGGCLILSGGTNGSGGLYGGIKLQLENSLSNTLVELKHIAANQRVLSLLYPSGVTNAEMPSNSGDLVIFIGEANIAPTSGYPSNGVSLYCLNGQLRIRQPDSSDFAIGSIPNPSIWGDLSLTESKTITYKEVAHTTTNTSLTFSYPLEDNASTNISALIVGKKVGSTDSAQYNLTMGYSRDGGDAPVAIGTVTSADTRTSGTASGWAAPSISIAGNSVVMSTGNNSATSIYWTIITQLTTVKTA